MLETGVDGGHDAGTDSAGDGSVDAGSLCGATLCADGQVCCSESMACYVSGCSMCCMHGACVEGGCDRRYYCQGMGCGTSGWCIPRPSDICETIYRPVCGCNDTTYTNDCYASAAGIRVAHSGECSKK